MLPRPLAVQANPLRSILRFSHAVAPTPQAMTRRSPRRPRKRPEWIVIGSNCGSSGTATPQVTYHGVDGYFAKKKYLDEAVRPRPAPDDQAAVRRRLSVSLHRPASKAPGARRKYDGKVNFQDLRRFASSRHHGRSGPSASLQLSSGTSRSNTSCGSWSWSTGKPPAKPRYIVLASTDLALDGRTLVELYGARFRLSFCSATANSSRG